jgi:hypothetical protein
MAMPAKQRLTFALKNKSIDRKSDTPDTPDSDSEQLMRLGVRKFSWHPAMETAMIADHADEDSESDTPDSYSQLMSKVNVQKSSWNRTSENTMAADTASRYCK